jgi:nitrogen fixation/metabolism regulation signal transduction histidine kinase
VTSVHKRKQFWVDPPLQLQMLAVVVCLVVASLVLVSFSVVYGLREASEDARLLVHSMDWVSDTMRAPLLLSSAISLLASGLITLIWSHRFAGPLRVLSAAMARLKAGNLSVPVRIRKMDTHQDLVKEFAAMQDALRAMVEEDRKKAHELAKKLEEAGHKDLAAEARGWAGKWQL